MENGCFVAVDSGSRLPDRCHIVSASPNRSKAGCIEQFDTGVAGTTRFKWKECIPTKDRGALAPRSFQRNVKIPPMSDARIGMLFFEEMNGIAPLFIQKKNRFADDGQLPYHC